MTDAVRAPSGVHECNPGKPLVLHRTRGFVVLWIPDGRGFLPE